MWVNIPAAIVMLGGAVFMACWWALLIVRLVWATLMDLVALGRRVGALGTKRQEGVR
jgi:hypothetical protein